MIDIAFHSYFKYLALGASLAIKKGFAGPDLHSESSAHSLKYYPDKYISFIYSRFGKISIRLDCFANYSVLYDNSD